MTITFDFDGAMLRMGGDNTIGAGSGDDALRAGGDNTIGAGFGDDALRGGGDNTIGAGHSDDAIQADVLPGVSFFGDGYVFG